MDPFLKMDIFFVVTTVAVVLLTGIFTLIAIQVVRILKHVERIAALVEEEAEEIRGDIAAVRAKVKEEGMKAALSFASWFPFGKRRGRKKRGSGE